MGIENWRESTKEQRKAIYDAHFPYHCDCGRVYTQKEWLVLAPHWQYADEYNGVGASECPCGKALFVTVPSVFSNEDGHTFEAILEKVRTKTRGPSKAPQALQVQPAIPSTPWGLQTDHTMFCPSEDNELFHEFLHQGHGTNLLTHLVLVHTSTRDPRGTVMVMGKEGEDPLVTGNAMLQLRRQFLAFRNLRRPLASP